ncbi:MULTISPECIES: 3-deoxy-manno-octulosonate cytidylyltransferase [Salegentibacter]|jgi:3-deoxy-D-manno-octulosonate cytidylyltransferase|uniref:3-deoxy-manno-octulosonate cytidylyltransferase n=1 Tax=Salegentibacter agarivorans TaxID=345907 RepID=A0A1I2PS05_9FLAO|nr:MULTISPECIES: 3-deoxy-manno-octulosonate cytidylyltransferase [Salegentibacter]APS39967.1 3-deoxy-manno-octulosonate cytidylyltransferase [Salegentibacter sp. T436]SFG18848.1 3-deoxy-manno-octulosonate cytidylyltransferase (CMP-KDO synthetase) [Salegentibacter agarivorans]
MNNPLKIIAMIPARYEASRFPGKLLKDLNGKTVITRTYEAAKKTGLFDEVYVVTDSDKIYAEINKNGGNAIKSKKEHECGSDRIAEAVQDMDVDIVVNVQGDEPFIDKDSLAKLLIVFREDDASAIDLASLKTALSESDEITNANNVKVITNKNDFAMYFSRFPIPYPRNTDAHVTYFKHIGIYAFRKQAIIDFYNLPMLSLESAEKIEAIRFLEYGKNIKMVETEMQTIGIDTPEDLEKARKIWNN